MTLCKTDAEESQELFRACIHEHGHAAVANALGVFAWVEVWPNESGNPDEKAWLGWTCHTPTNDPATLSAILAGVVSEILLIDFPADGYTFAEAEQAAAMVRQMFPTGRHSKRMAFTEWCGVVVQEIAERLDDLSETDLAGMGEQWHKHVRKAVRLVMKHLEEILWESKNRERSWHGFGNAHIQIWIGSQNREKLGQIAEQTNRTLGEVVDAILTETLAKDMA